MVSASSSRKMMGYVCYQCRKSTLRVVWCWRVPSSPFFESDWDYFYTFSSTYFLVIGIQVRFKSCPIASPNLSWHQGYCLLHYDHFAWSDLYSMWYSENWSWSRAGNSYFSGRCCYSKVKYTLAKASFH